MQGNISPHKASRPGVMSPQLFFGVHRLQLLNSLQASSRGSQPVGTKDQARMAKKRKASNLDTPTYHLATTPPIALTVLQHS